MITLLRPCRHAHDRSQTVYKEVDSRMDIVTLVVGLYDRRIRDVEAFCSSKVKMHFTVDDLALNAANLIRRQPDASEEERSNAQETVRQGMSQRLFAKQLLRYLRGKGHPMGNQLVALGLLTQSDVSKSVSRPLCFLKLFTNDQTGNFRQNPHRDALTSSHRFTLDPGRSTLVYRGVYFCMDGTDMFSYSILQIHFPEGKGRPPGASFLGIHTCTNTLDVFFTKDLYDLL